MTVSKMINDHKKWNKSFKVIFSVINFSIKKRMHKKAKKVINFDLDINSYKKGYEHDQRNKLDYFLPACFLSGLSPLSVVAVLF